MRCSLPLLPRLAHWLCLLTACFVLPAPAFALFGEDWLPVPPEDLAQTASTIDPEAGAEVLYREVKVDDTNEGASAGSSFTLVEEYVRIKIFDQRGLERLTPFTLTFPESYRVRNIRGRVIKPDGTVVQLSSDDINSRRTRRDEESSYYTHSFSFPGAEVGAIVECKLEIISDQLGNRSGIQSPATSIPVRRYHLEFQGYEGMALRWLLFRIPDGAVKKRQHGFTLDMENIPSLPSEPNMPPPMSIQPWVMIFYAYTTNVSSELYWKDFCDHLAKLDDTYIRPKQANIKEKAAELIAGKATEAEKLHAIYNFCSREIRNTARADVDRKERPDKSRQTPSEILESGVANPLEVCSLFASLAEAAGFEVHLTGVNNRALMEFNKEGTCNLMTPIAAAVVKVDGTWQFFQPGRPFVPYGMMHWSNENTGAAVANHKDADLRVVPSSPAEATQMTRKADLTLAEDGSVRGTFSISLTGHRAIRRREQLCGRTPEQRVEDFVKEIRKKLPEAELTDLQFLNLEDIDLPLEIRGQISVPAYAQKTGTRLILQPSFFEYGSEPRLKRDTRETPLRFNFPWASRDIVKITIPDSYTVEDGKAPRSLANTPQFTHQIKMGMLKGRNTLYYERIERQNTLGVPQSEYPIVKGYYDDIYAVDQHVITFRQITPEAEPVAVVTAP